MQNIMQQLEQLNSREWDELFAHMEREERRSIASRNNDLLYRYLGEIDCPEEMFQDFATVADVRNAGGKTNWFVCSDGTFFTCGDCAVDALFDSGKTVDYEFPFEMEREEKYRRLSKDERIAFRIALQGISEEQAKEIVCHELGITAYKNTYKFSIKETFVNSFDKATETKTYMEFVEADTEEEAREKFIAESYGIGFVAERGSIYTEEDKKRIPESVRIFSCKGGTPYTVSLQSRDITLIAVWENENYWDLF